MSWYARWLRPFLKAENFPAMLTLLAGLAGAIALSTGWRGTGFGVSAVAWALLLLALTLIVQRSWALANIENRLSAAAPGYFAKRADYFNPMAELKAAKEDSRTEAWLCSPTGRTWIQDYKTYWEELHKRCKLTFIIMNPNSADVEPTSAYFGVSPETVRGDIRSTLDCLSPLVKASSGRKRRTVAVYLLDQMPVMCIRYFRGGSKPDACSVELYPYRSSPPDRPGRRLDPVAEAHWMRVFRSHLQKLRGPCEEWDGEVDKLFPRTEAAAPAREGRSRLAASRRHVD